jgi:hypothetical protein
MAMRPWDRMALRRIIGRLEGFFTVEVEVKEIDGRQMLCTTGINQALQPCWQEMVEVKG